MFHVPSSYHSPKVSLPAQEHPGVQEPEKLLSPCLTCPIPVCAQLPGWRQSSAGSWECRDAVTCQCRGRDTSILIPCCRMMLQLLPVAAGIPDGPNTLLRRAGKALGKELLAVGGAG